MRLVKVSAPAGWAEKIKETAFESGVESVTIRTVVQHRKNAQPEEMDVVDIETSTPRAKRFVDNLLAADYYDREKISFNTRQPRSLIGGEDDKELTRPMVEPATDLYEELWQFSHMTFGLATRILISACLLSYGMIESKLLLMIGGLLFLPILPMAMAVSYGIAGRRWRLAAQGLAAIGTATALLFAGGVIVALVARPPLRFDDLGSPVMGIIISAAVGVAAALASIDDAGRREMIGLAAASQLGLIPVWLGIITVFGLSAGSDSGEVLTRILSFATNLVVLVIALLSVQLATGAAGRIDKVK